MNKWEKSHKTHDIKWSKQAHYVILKKKKLEEDWIIISRHPTLKEAINEKAKLSSKFPFSDSNIGPLWELKIQSIYQNG